MVVRSLRISASACAVRSYWLDGEVGAAGVGATDWTVAFAVAARSGATATGDAPPAGCTGAELAPPGVGTGLIDADDWPRPGSESRTASMPAAELVALLSNRSTSRAVLDVLAGPGPAAPGTAAAPGPAGPGTAAAPGPAGPGAAAAPGPAGPGTAAAPGPAGPGAAAAPDPADTLRQIRDNQRSLRCPVLSALACRTRLKIPFPALTSGAAS